MSEKPLFQNTDEQEALYAPQQVPENEQVAADETSGIVRSSIARGDTPVSVPISTGGSGAAATPPSDSFEPGMEREARDLQQGDTSVVGPDPRDEAEVEHRRGR